MDPRSSRRSTTARVDPRTERQSGSSSSETTRESGVLPAPDRPTNPTTVVMYQGNPSPSTVGVPVCAAALAAAPEAGIRWYPSDPSIYRVQAATRPGRYVRCRLPSVVAGTRAPETGTGGRASTRRSRTTRRVASRHRDSGPRSIACPADSRRNVGRDGAGRSHER